ncbi:MAG: hypothetical protein OK454_08640, partial [Thaumarchaeota archaeon]|nr:hypothetical protein [Nitrososphaerota archaeon]
GRIALMGPPPLLPLLSSLIKDFGFFLIQVVSLSLVIILSQVEIYHQGEIIHEHEEEIRALRLENQKLWLCPDEHRKPKAEPT